MKEKRQSLLWEIAGADLPGRSYLFGTMHVRDRRAFRLLSPVQECILSCEAFATEFHLEEATAQPDLHLLHLPPGQTLDQLVPPRRYVKLRRILHRATGLDLDRLRDKQPIIIANMVDEAMLMRDMPFALDEMLWLFARRHDKLLLGIETYQEQISVVQQISLQEQLKGLLTMSRHISRHRRHLLHMTDLYEEGNIQQLYQSARRGAQGLRKLMLYNRNVRMADRIAASAREQTTLFAIGAGHLAGGKGVLRLLKQRKLHLRPLIMG